jgi:hypothetical protein
MQRNKLKSQETIYLSEEDLQDILKQDGATLSLIKTGGIEYEKRRIGLFPCC